MKNRMKPRKAIGKISTFLRMLVSKSNGYSETRHLLRNPNNKPSSTKIAKCSMDNWKVYRTNKYMFNANRKGRINDVMPTEN